MKFTRQLLENGWTRPERKHEERVRKFSTTGDILSFKRCRRQYGFFGVRGFASATATQRYFGTLVHDVLDRINRAYQLNPVLPDKALVEQYVEEAHERLWRAGVRPYSVSEQKERAKTMVWRFVQLVGPFFFKHVKHTEYRLERALRTPGGRDYVLDGIVDVLSGAVSHEIGLPYATEPDDVEIWDYKSGKMPKGSSRELQDYIFQMRVYAELYRRQTGDFPARSVLVFVGELLDDELWNAARMDPTRFPRLVYPMHPTPKHVDIAMNDFHSTVELIESEYEKPFEQQWMAPDHDVDEGTCEACEIRYNCACFQDGGRQLAEAL